jgi:integration host factor subunit alpha
MTLTKANLVDRIYERCGLSKKEAQEIVELVFSEMKTFFKDGKSLKISGFGNFNVKQKRARRGRNPQTGDAMTISERRVLTFSVSQVFKEMLKKSKGETTSQQVADALSSDTD